MTEETKAARHEGNTDYRPEPDSSELDDDDESLELDLASTVGVGFGADLR